MATFWFIADESGIQLSAPFASEAEARAYLMGIEETNRDAYGLHVQDCEEPPSITYANAQQYIEAYFAACDDALTVSFYNWQREGELVHVNVSLTEYGEQAWYQWTCWYEPLVGGVYGEF